MNANRKLENKEKLALQYIHVRNEIDQKDYCNLLITAQK